MKKRGFTLIELMIVVVITGILSAIAIPKYTDLTESARYTACRSNLRNVVQGLNMYLAENGAYPPGNRWQGLDTISSYVHQEMQCPTTGADYRYRIRSQNPGTFRVRGWNGSCKRNHGWYRDGVYIN